MNSLPAVLIVPGLRDAVEDHWQTLFAARWPRCRTVAPMGRVHIDCATRVAALEKEAAEIDGPFVIVAHSAGCITVAHWAARTQQAVKGALLAVPPDFERPLPEGYPTVDALDAAGWRPVPRSRLPFPCLVGASRNDPLARYEYAENLATCWGAQLVDLGLVGHLNPASGYGDWPQVEALIERVLAIQ